MESIYGIQNLNPATNTETIVIPFGTENILKYIKTPDGRSFEAYDSAAITDGRLKYKIYSNGEEVKIPLKYLPTGVYDIQITYNDNPLDINTLIIGAEGSHKLLI